MQADPDACESPRAETVFPLTFGGFGCTVTLPRCGEVPNILRFIQIILSARGAPGAHNMCVRLGLHARSFAAAHYLKTSAKELGHGLDALGFG